MRPLLLAVLMLLLGHSLSGCTADPAILTKQDERTLAAQIFETFGRARSEHGQFPVPAGSNLKAGGYRGLSAELPGGKPVLVGAHRIAGSAGSKTLLTYSLDGPGQHRLVSLHITRTAAGPMADHVQVIRLPRPYSELKGLRWNEASVGGFALLLLPLAAIAVAIAGIARIWRSGRFGHRWLWTIGCLLGLTELRILWPSGRVFLQPFHLNILPAGARQIGPIPDSWLIVATIPVVAIVVLLIRRGDVAPTQTTTSHPEASVAH